jgi:mycothiol system anti-sigma-R factor
MSCGNSSEGDCGEILRRIHQYLDGELDADDVDKIRQHLDECAPCLGEYDIDLMLKALVRRSCGGECAPEQLREKILSRISEARLHLG